MTGPTTVRATQETWDALFKLASNRQITELLNLLPIIPAWYTVRPGDDVISLRCPCGAGDHIDLLPKSEGHTVRMKDRTARMVPGRDTVFRCGQCTHCGRAWYQPGLPPAC